MGRLFEANPQKAIDQVLAADPRTVVIRWRLPYVEAGSLSGAKTGFPPMPRHILGGGDGRRSVQRREPPVLDARAGGAGALSPAAVGAWRRAGIDAILSATPPALATNNEYRGTFPAFAITKSSLPERTAVRKYATADVAAPENRWGGTNKGGCSHPEYDRLNLADQAALDRSERNDLVVQMMKLAGEELPAFPLYYDLTVIAHAASLKGPLPSAPDGLELWNIHEWEWR